MNSVRAGIALGRARIDVRRSVAFVLVSAMIAAAVALTVRASAPLAAEDAVLEGIFGYLLPLLSFSRISHVADRRRMVEATWPAARFGASRWRVAMGLALVGWCVTVATIAPALFVGLGLAHRLSPTALRDLTTPLGLLCLGAAAYVMLFALASTLFRRGRGRLVALGLDFVVGGSSTIVGALFPRSHLESLLGGDGVLSLSQRQSSFVLGALVLVTSAALRIRLRD